MEISLDSEKDGKMVSSGQRGGLRTMPFIIANEAFERVASVGLHINMTIYLKYEYHLENATVTVILFWWGAISNFLPTLGAFLSDSYMGRFLVIAFGTVISLAGQVLLLLTALLTVATPPYCKDFPKNCIKPNVGQFALLFSSFALMSIGAGGIRACSLAFGADQVDNPQKPKNQRVTQGFFNWYYACVSVSVMFAITVIVYIQTDYGWKIGFGVPVGLMFLSTVLFFLGSKLYVKLHPDKSLMTGLAQVVVVAWKNKHLSLPPINSAGEWYHNDKNSKQTFPTKRLRFLNRACIIRNPEKDLNPDGSISDPWNLCTAEQVENLKSLIKVIPIWSTSIIIAVTISQHSFYVLQAITMDRTLPGSSFKIPPASFTAFGVLTLGIWIAIYDQVIVPSLSKYTKNKRGLSFEQRIGTGLFLSCLTTAVAALVERKRRTTAIQQGLADNQVGVVNMSAMWLVPQFCMTGLSEAFNAIGQIEYYYAHFPKKMSSIGVALFSLGMAAGNLVGSVIVQIVNHFSGSSGKGRVKWISDNLNQGHYDYYYWVLTLLSLVNFLCFILLTFFYECSEDQKLSSEEEDIEEEIIIKEENADKSSRGL